MENDGARASVRAALEELAARARTGALPPSARRPGDDAAADGYRRAAVMVLLTPHVQRPAPPAPGVDVFLVQRADHLRHHPGEISLPGGRVEEDDADDAAAALRELAEETGLDPGDVDVVGQLPPLLLPVSRNVVTPVLGWSGAVSRAGHVAPGEVVRTLRVPVAELLDPAARATVRIRGHRTPGFATPAGWVWGFTGLLLDEMFTALGWTRSWEPSREVVMAYDRNLRRTVVREAAAG
ncbi:CoA pyrophosphatase [Georgenia sp. 10Sc9-8]|uniref:CoA pyrophosphatase n=1 Tax=Georgenia halotolerans TaxID=3028317 RepID=A0ABT5TYF2_9MICO|nr:CoA pyrophosphatase [Georgenia halotolerans]